MPRGMWAQRRLLGGLWLRARPSWERQPGLQRPPSLHLQLLHHDPSPLAEGASPCWPCWPSGSCHHRRVWLPAEAGWASACREEEGVAYLPPPLPPTCFIGALQRSSPVLTVLPGGTGGLGVGGASSPPRTLPFRELRSPSRLFPFHLNCISQGCPTRKENAQQ